MITETISAVSGIKTALDIAKGLSALKNEIEVNQAVIDIQQVLLDAQQASFEDKQLIANLTRQLVAAEEARKSVDQWELEKQRYVLTKSELGAFTYNLRPEAANGDVPHRLCTNCFVKDRKSILHTKRKHSGGEVVICHECKTEITLSKFNHSTAPSLRTPWS